MFIKLILQSPNWKYWKYLSRGWGCHNSIMSRGGRVSQNVHVQRVGCWKKLPPTPPPGTFLEQPLMYSNLYIGNVDGMKPGLLLFKSITNASKSYHQHLKSTVDMNYVEKYYVFICATVGTGWQNNVNAFLLLRTNVSMEYCNEKVGEKICKKIRLRLGVNK